MNGQMSAVFVVWWALVVLLPSLAFLAAIFRLIATSLREERRFTFALRGLLATLGLLLILRLLGVVHP